VFDGINSPERISLIRNQFSPLTMLKHALTVCFCSKSLAMRFRKNLQNSSKYDISNYSDDDFWSYYDRFLKLLNKFHLYWSTMDACAAFKLQRTMFISGAKAPSFATILDDHRDSILTLEDIRLCVVETSLFAQQFRLMKYRPKPKKM
jgi:hypothetical protein